MPSPSELNFDPITTDWTYVRWLGNRKAVERVTQTWDKTVVDRTAELGSWVDYCYQLQRVRRDSWAFARTFAAAFVVLRMDQLKQDVSMRGYRNRLEKKPCHTNENDSRG